MLLTLASNVLMHFSYLVRVPFILITHPSQFSGATGPSLLIWDTPPEICSCDILSQNTPVSKRTSHQVLLSSVGLQCWQWMTWMPIASSYWYDVCSGWPRINQGRALNTYLLNEWITWTPLSAWNLPLSSPLGSDSSSEPSLYPYYLFLILECWKEWDNHLTTSVSLKQESMFYKSLYLSQHLT